MNKLLLILILIGCSSCGQPTKSGNGKRDVMQIESSPEVGIAQNEQHSESKEIAENQDCADFDFESTEQRADSLITFMTKATDSSLSNQIVWEQKFFCAFPNSFKGMQLLFGYDDSKGAAPLYSTESETYSYAHKHIMSDVIGYFSELKSIPDSIYYKKYARINIDGYWEADNIIEAFGLSHRLVSDSESACRTLSGFSDKELRSVFHFIFDGPHPKNDYNAMLYKKLQSETDTQSKRISRLLTEAYENLMAVEEKHGH